jgi:hypothetical protein
MIVDPQLQSAVVPFANGISKAALAKLESLFSFPQTRIPKDTAEGLARVSGLSPELANALGAQVGAPPSSVE